MHGLLRFCLLCFLAAPTPSLTEPRNAALYANQGFKGGEGTGHHLLVEVLRSSFGEVQIEHTLTNKSKSRNENYEKSDPISMRSM